MENLIVDLLKADHLRWHALGLVEQLGVPSACIGAGFVRNLVWDHLHGRDSDCRIHDLDVLWFDREKATPRFDSQLEKELHELDSGFDWSVKNQARMHERNGDEPYSSISEAMRHWPETATAIAVRRSLDLCEIIAPFGLEDLFALTVRPTSSRPDKLEAFAERTEQKKWMARWPNVRVSTALLL